MMSQGDILGGICFGAVIIAFIAMGFMSKNTLKSDK